MKALLGLLLVTNLFSTPIINNYERMNHLKITGIEEVSKSGIIIDTNNVSEENISVFFIQRNGAFIAVQTLLAILNTAQKFPNKEIYLYVSPGITPDDANGFINYELLEQANPKIHYNKSVSKEIITDKDLELPRSEAIKKEVKLDIYVEDFAYSLGEMPTYLKESWKNIETLTLSTDGTANQGFNNSTKVWIDSMEQSYLNELSEIWRKIFNGEIIIDSIDDQRLLNDLNKVLPTLMIENENGRTFINTWAASIQMYNESSVYQPAWNQKGTGLAEAFNALTFENKELYRNLYSIKQDEYSYTENKTNIVYSGSLMVGSSTLGAEVKAIEDIYNLHNVPLGGVNVLYKPHPRETSKSLDNLKHEINKLNSGINIDWIHIVEQRVPIEVFTFAEIFKQTKLTRFKYHIFGTSTSVQTFYEAGVSDQVERFIFTNKSSHDEAIALYGINSTVLDFNKSHILDGIKNIVPHSFAKIIIYSSIGTSLFFITGSITLVIFFKKRKTKIKITEIS